MVYCDGIITFSEVAKERNLTQDQISQEDPKDTVKPPEEKHTKLSPEYSRVKDLQKKIHRKENFRKTRIERDEKLTINLLDTLDENRLRRILRIKITGGSMRMSLLS